MFLISDFIISEVRFRFYKYSMFNLFTKREFALGFEAHCFWEECTFIAG